MREPQAGQQRVYCVNCLFSSSILHYENSGPLAVCMDHHHKHFPLNRPGKIHMKPQSAREGWETLNDAELTGLDCSRLPDTQHNFGQCFRFLCQCLATKCTHETPTSFWPYRWALYEVLPEFLIWRAQLLYFPTSGYHDGLKGWGRGGLASLSASLPPQVQEHEIERGPSLFAALVLVLSQEESQSQRHETSPLHPICRKVPKVVGDETGHRS